MSFYLELVLQMLFANHESSRSDSQVGVTRCFGILSVKLVARI